jgi:phytoene synthase
MSEKELATCYRHCRQIVSRSGSNFALAFWLLPRPKREAMHALYAFARLTDDLGDGDGSISERQAKLTQWRRSLELADAPVTAAMRDTARRYEIPPALLDEIISGVERDLTQTRYATWTDLQSYCYQVAGAVGLACLHVWGYRGPAPDALARTCGEAFQLTNILRDVREDADRGRCYLPQEDLRKFELTFDAPLRPGLLPRFDALMAFELDRAERLFEEAAELHQVLSRDGQRVFRLMFGRYRAILAKIRTKPRAVLERRLSLSLPHKLWIAGRKLCASRP